MSRRGQGSDDRGLVLLNVLATVAVGSAIAVMMVVSQDSAIDRGTALREAGQALAYARGGELSAIVALRRDMELSPETDHGREAWASVAQREIAIEGGRFSLTIEDAQGRFNINTLAGGGLTAQASFGALLNAARLPTAYAEPVARYVAAFGPLDSVYDLAPTGLPPAEMARLEPWVVALPPDAALNVNAADEAVLGALMQNAVAARFLVERRARVGYLGVADFQNVGLVMPPGAGFTSDHFRVATEVQAGETRQRVVSLLRRRRIDGRAEVVVVRRTREAAVSRPTDRAGEPRRS